MQYRLDQFLSVRSAFSPRFSRDGSRLYFLSDLTGAPLLWSVLLDREERWPEPVGVGFDRVISCWPSPTTEQLVVAADVGGDERTQLHLIEQPGVTPRPLTHDEAAIFHFGGWHPDGAQVSYSSNERDPRFFDAYVLDVETGRRRLVLQADGSYYAAGFSPDGRRLLVREAGSSWSNAIYVVDLESGAWRQLTPAGLEARYQQPCWSADGQTIYCVSDAHRDFLALGAMSAATGELRWLAQPEWDVDDCALSPDGQRLVYEVNVDGYSEVKVRDLATGEDSAIPLPLGQVHEGMKWLNTFSWSPCGEQVAFTFSAADRPANVYVAKPDGAAPRRVTSTWTAGLDPANLATAELVHYPTFDGRSIPAYVYKPRGHRMDGTSPALFYVHGGPELQIRTMYNGVIQYFVHRGFVVVAPNVRGSLGYGRPYVHLDDVELRPDSVRDLAEAARWVADTGLAHTERLAVMGASYGGYMVLAALTSNPELWAAGVDIVGIANFETFLERTGPWRRHHREVEYGSLAEHREILVELSPIHKADRIVAPLMVIHGANDPRVPIHEAEQIVETLRARGRAVEYLRFEDEGHGLVKLRNRLQAYPRIADFLERYLDVSRPGLEAAGSVPPGERVVALT